MPITFNGQLDSRGLRFAIGLARFNSFVTERLLEGALDAIARTGGDTESVEVYRIPGAWELPVLVKRLAQQQRFDAILCLGAVVRGDTPHFDYVAGESARGLAHIALDTGLPILNGVLTTNTLEQAIDRAGGKAGNKGFDAAMAAIEIAHLFRQMGKKGQP